MADFMFTVGSECCGFPAVCGCGGPVHVSQAAAVDGHWWRNLLGRMWHIQVHDSCILDPGKNVVLDDLYTY